MMKIKKNAIVSDGIFLFIDTESIPKFSGQYDNL